jgi:hypothetical protein
MLSKLLLPHPTFAFISPRFALDGEAQQDLSTTFTNVYFHRNRLALFCFFVMRSLTLIYLKNGERVIAHLFTPFY